jgi:hypothetical protein
MGLDIYTKIFTKPGYCDSWTTLKCLIDRLEAVENELRCRDKGTEQKHYSYLSNSEVSDLANNRLNNGEIIALLKRAIYSRRDKAWYREELERIVCELRLHNCPD